MTDVIDYDETTVVQLDNQYNALDEDSLDQLRSLLLECVDRRSPPRVVIDMSHTDFIGSLVIGILVQAWKRIRERHGRMIVCSVSPICASVLHTVHLDQVWEFAPNRTEAIARANEDDQPAS